MNRNNRKPTQDSDDGVSEIGLELVLSLDFADWYNNSWKSQVIQSSEKGKIDKIPLSTITDKYKEAEKLLGEAKKAFDSTQKQTQDDKFVSTAIKSGTLTDKMAAITLRFQEAPFFRLETLEQLLALSNKKNRREQKLAVEHLTDLFLNNVLPDRKLVHFADRPLNHPDVTNLDLAYWFYEDKLKKYYHDFVTTVEKATHDILADHKERMMSILFELLSKKPEQEKNLLTYLVNKMGDSDRPVSSKAGYLLEKLWKAHPGMKLHICKEVETFLFRPNVGELAQYYGVNFLNQIMLTADEEQLASKLMEIYFRLFNQYDNEKEVESKMLEALLAGIRRAFPYSPFQEAQFQEHMNSLFKIAHATSFGKSVQALQLIFQVETSSENAVASDRYYRALYDRLLTCDLVHSSKHTQFLNLVYKSMKNDEKLARVEAFSKRLLQVCNLQEPQFACAALFIISRLIRDKPLLSKMISQPENERKFNKNDDDTGKKKKGNQKENDGSNNKKTEGKVVKKPAVPDSDDEEERFVDHDEEDEDYHGVDKARISKEELEAMKHKVTSSKTSSSTESTDSNGTHSSNNNDNNGIISKDSVYDPHKREPLYAKAENTCLWELIPLKNHYHPSVARFALLILENKPVEYQGDPLQDFVRSTFLERFVYKNPKKPTRKNAGKTVEESIHKSKSAVRSISRVPVNSEQYLERRRIPEDEQFFYNFFKLANSEHSLRKKKKKEEKSPEDLDDNLDDEVTDEQFDEYLKDYFKGTEHDITKDIDGEEDEDALLDALEADNDEDDDDDLLGSQYADDDEDDDEALAMAEMDGEFATKAAKKKFQNQDNFDDEDDDDMEGLDQDIDDDDDNDDGFGFMMDDDDDLIEDKGQKSSKRESAFASADDFAELLEKAGDEYDGASKKQIQWEKSRLSDKKSFKKNKSRADNKKRPFSAKPKINNKRKK